MDIKAFKMDGLGNDFVIIDNREKVNILSKEQIIKVCNRNFIGCDQLILIENDKINIEEIFDLDKWATFFAATDLTANSRGKLLNNNARLLRLHRTGVIAHQRGRRHPQGNYQY